MAGRRAILHVDMDAFFAAIEQLDRPELRGRPVLVGGDGPRGVVAAASYEARRFGCHSAQPMAVAKRRCPQALIVAPRGRRYREVSQAVFAVLESYTPLVEPLSIDEAFLDVTGSEALHGPGPVIAASIKRRIRDEIGLTASVGVASNKFLAKLASDLDKPDGLTVIEPDRAAETIAGLPVGRMWGVGPAMELELGALGVRTFGDLDRLGAGALAARFGPHAQRLAQLARGEDDRPVVPDRTARSISQEQTFAHDVEAPDVVREVLVGQVAAVGRRLRAAGLRAGTAVVKIRYGDFETITRSSALGEPTDLTDRLRETACALFDRWARSSFQPVRLIGFGVGRLAGDPAQMALFGQAGDDRRRAVDLVADAIQDRYGPSAINRGLRPSPGAGPPSPRPGA